MVEVWYVALDGAVAHQKGPDFPRARSRHPNFTPEIASPNLHHRPVTRVSVFWAKTWVTMKLGSGEKDPKSFLGYSSGRCAEAKPQPRAAYIFACFTAISTSLDISP
jgi:hypothetical protein